MTFWDQMTSHWQEISAELEKIRTKNLYRQCKVSSGIDFCSNDYLGLAKSGLLEEKMKENLSQDTLGSTAARLIKGHRQSMEDWERKFSEFVGAGASLSLANGYVANMGLIDTIADSRTAVFTDRLNHASILDGIRISGAIKKYYDHLDLDHLEEQVSKWDRDPASPGKRKKIIVSETLFSMDGDKPDIRRLVEIKKKYDCVLILDEAHSFGVFGKEGRGMCFEDLSREEMDSIEYRVYTLGKSLGLEGGIIATTELGREHLVNRMRPFIFSTAPMPMIFTTASDSLDLIRDMEKEREHLLHIASILRDGLAREGFSVSSTVSQIVPILMDTEEEALYYSAELRKIGFDVIAIRPPTVPTPRLRVSLNALLTEKEILSLIEALVVVRRTKR